MQYDEKKRFTFLEVSEVEHCTKIQCTISMYLKIVGINDTKLVNVYKNLVIQKLNRNID